MRILGAARLTTPPGWRSSRLKPHGADLADGEPHHNSPRPRSSIQHFNAHAPHELAGISALVMEKSLHAWQPGKAYPCGYLKTPEDAVYSASNLRTALQKQRCESDGPDDPTPPTGAPLLQDDYSPASRVDAILVSHRRSK